MEHHSFIRTRFCESDAFGHINNVSFFIYLEQARVDFFVDSHILDATKDWSFVVASQRCDYIKQAYITQNLVVKTGVSNIGNTSVSLKHKIVDQSSEELIAKGEVVLVAFDFTRQQSQPLNERMIEKLKQYTL
ncbi:MAG TPA: acyl-CoA thioesterase [Bacillales bacterium]|nr:acyl-CoA thioesterase [Bacillales bacterium]